MSAARASVWFIAVALLLSACVVVRADGVKSVDARQAVRSCFDKGGTYADCFRLVSRQKSIGHGGSMLFPGFRADSSLAECEDACYASAALSSCDCVLMGVVDDACMAEVDADLCVCLDGCDGQIVPTSDLPSCDTLCVASAEEYRRNCERMGGTDADCADQANDLYDACFDEECTWPATCADLCADDGAVAYDECVRSGGTLAEACYDMARELVDTCVAAECPPFSVYSDGNQLDAVPRPVLPVPLSPLDPAIDFLPDLMAMRLGAWAPANLTDNLFEGDYTVYQSGPFGSQDVFFRLDLAFWGLVNPPGPAGPDVYDPYLYGAHPVYGFVEIDVDDNVMTGGEVEAPQHRYLGNVARFGGMVQRDVFRERVALGRVAFDQDLLTLPFVERHGEEFHLALLGGQFQPTDVSVREGDNDSQFESGETWQIHGPFLHRAHGYSALTFMEGPDGDGEYMPTCQLQFRHDIERDITLVSLLSPLTNAAAAQLVDQQPQVENANAWDQTSIQEALWDLRFAALFHRQFQEGLYGADLISGWVFREPATCLDPQQWRATALLGTADPVLQVGHWSVLWSDVWPNVVAGDFDGSGEADDADVAELQAYVELNDPTDGVYDAAVVVPDFPWNFNMFDVDYDGVVSYMEHVWHRPQWKGHVGGDLDRDWDVDLADLAVYQNCHGRSPLPFACLLVDYDGNQVIDEQDFAALIGLFSGPEGFPFDVAPDLP